MSFLSVGVALFGRRGHAPDAALLSQPIPNAVLEEASRHFGYEVLTSLAR